MGKDLEDHGGGFNVSDGSGMQRNSVALDGEAQALQSSEHEILAESAEQNRAKNPGIYGASITALSESQAGNRDVELHAHQEKGHMEESEVGMAVAETSMGYEHCVGGTAEHSSAHEIWGNLPEADTVEQGEHVQVQLVGATMEQPVDNGCPEMLLCNVNLRPLKACTQIMHASSQMILRRQQVLYNDMMSSKRL